MARGESTTGLLKIIDLNVDGETIIREDIPQEMF